MVPHILPICASSTYHLNPYLIFVYQLNHFILFLCYLSLRDLLMLFTSYSPILLLAIWHVLVSAILSIGPLVHPLYCPGYPIFILHSDVYSCLRFCCLVIWFCPFSILLVWLYHYPIFVIQFLFCLVILLSHFLWSFAVWFFYISSPVSGFPVAAILLSCYPILVL